MEETLTSSISFYSFLFYESLVFEMKNWSLFSLLFDEVLIHDKENLHGHFTLWHNHINHLCFHILGVHQCLVWVKTCNRKWNRLTHCRSFGILVYFNFYSFEIMHHCPCCIFRILFWLVSCISFFTLPDNSQAMSTPQYFFLFVGLIASISNQSSKQVHRIIIFYSCSCYNIADFIN